MHVDKSSRIATRRSQKLEQVNDILERATKRSSFYRSRLETTSLDSIDEITQLPLTTQEELRKEGSLSTIIGNTHELAEFHTSSGSTGNPFIMGLSYGDLATAKRALAKTWRLHGVKKSDLVQMMMSYGLFTAGVINQHALQHIGAGIIPTGIQATEVQLEYMTKLEPDYLVAVSSYYLRLSNIAEKTGYKIPDLKGIVGGGVPVSEKMRAHITDRFNAPFYNQYGLAEINTGIAGECSAHEGLHVQDSYVFPEIVDPETHEPLGEGEEGVLVLTTLGRKDQPLIRYLTNDITSITYEQCSCGRRTPRLSPIKGRTDDIIFVRGTKLDLTYIQSVMESHDDLIDPFRWQLRIDRENGRDVIRCHVIWRDTERSEYLRSTLKDRLGITIDEVTSSPDELNDAMEHKLDHMVDDR